MSSPSPYRSLRAQIKKLRNYLIPVWQYAIPVEGTEESLRLVFLGWDRKLRNYWLTRLSGRSAERKRKRLIISRHINKFLLKSRDVTDLAIAQHEGLEISGQHFPQSLLLPRWMEMIISTDPSRNNVRAKEIRRRIRKHALEFRFSTSESELDLFYKTMYRPLLGSRHAGSAEYASYQFLQGKIRRGAELLFACLGDVPIAGQLIEHVKGIPRILTFGVLDGNEKYIKMGVHGALYYYALNHYKDRGIAEIRCGSSMPLVLDGVTQFKIRMGAYPYRQDLKNRQTYRVIPLGSGPALRSALKENPLIYLSGNNLNQIWYVDPLLFSNKEKFIEYVKRIRVTHVDQTYYCHFNDPGKLQSWMNEAQLESAHIISYEEITG